MDILDDGVFRALKHYNAPLLLLSDMGLQIWGCIIVYQLHVSRCENWCKFGSVISGVGNRFLQENIN
jgi:hypothetical protein